MDKRPKEQWASRLGVVLAVAGSAVGLGNFLRFPGTAAENGGGVFMIPYICALVLLGIPMCWAEWIMGKYGGQRGFNSAPAIFGAVGGHRGWRYVGIIGVLVPIIIYTYYILIEAWCLGYAWHYLTGGLDLGHDPTLYAKNSEAFFAHFTGIAGDGVLFADGVSSAALFWMITLVGNLFLIYRGLSRGIEAFCKVAMPVMALCAVIVLIRVLTLGTPDPAHPERGVLEGLGFMWNPRAMDAGTATWLSTLADPHVWMASAGQIFFSISVGFGVIINYASYLKRNDDVVLSGLTAAATNEFFEVILGGLITIPAAFVFLGAAGAVGGTFGLGFNTLPVVFEYMPAGRLFGFLWFFMLFLAAVTSSISMLQPAIAFLEEGLGIGRRASVALLGSVTGAASFFVVWFSGGLTALDTLDFWGGTFLIFVLATFEVILFAWVFGTDKGVEFARHGAQLELPRVFRFVVKWVSPTYLLVVFAIWCWQKLPDYVRTLADGGVPLLAFALIATMFALLVILTRMAGRRWDAVRSAAPSHAKDEAVAQRITGAVS